MSDILTTRQVGEMLGQPQWRIRRIVDRLDGIEKFGGKRAIPRSKLPAIIKAIRALDRTAEAAT